MFIWADTCYVAKSMIMIFLIHRYEYIENVNTSKVNTVKWKTENTIKIIINSEEHFFKVSIFFWYSKI